MIRGSIKYVLETWEVLNNIMTYFFKFDKLIFDYIPEQKDKYLML